VKYIPIWGGCGVELTDEVWAPNSHQLPMNLTPVIKCRYWLADLVCYSCFAVLVCMMTMTMCRIADAKISAKSRS